MLKLQVQYATGKSITQNNIVIDESAQLTSNASDIKSTVNNAATTSTLVLTGGATSKDITGGGKVVVQNTVTLNNSTGSNAVQLDDGSTLEVRDNGDISSNSSLIAKGGTLDYADGNIGTSSINLGNIDITNSNLNLVLDVDLNGTPKADVFTANSVNVGTSDNQILISTINLLHKASGPITVKVLVADSAIMSSVDIAAGATSASVEGESYVVSYSNTDGKLIFDYEGLPAAVHSTAPTKVYDMGKDEDLRTDLGDLG